MGFVNPCQSWLGSWVGVFGLGLWCCPSFAGCLWCSWLGFGVGLLLGRVWFRARFACPPPFPVPMCGVGVRAGPGSRLCPALVGWVVGVCFLRFFFPVVGCPCPGPCGLSPHPLSFGLAAGFFFFLVCVCLFRCPFFLVGRCSWLGVAGFGWVVPLCLFGGPVFGALWVGGLVAFCVVGGRFGGCGVFRAAPPSPPLFFGGGGAAWLFLPLPSLRWRSLCGWCVVWLVPRHSWRGFAAGVGGRSPPLLAGVHWRRWCVVCGVWRWCVGGVVAGVWCGWSLATPGGGSCVLLPATPGWVSLPVVVGGPRHSWLGSAGGVVVWCVVCGGGVLVGLWLVCGVVGPSPLLAEVPVCYSLPLLAGFRCRCWWAVPATPGRGPLAAVVCGVWCVAVVCWWGCGWCVVWFVPRHSRRRCLCATPRDSWLGFAAGGGGRYQPLPAGVRGRRWCVVCGVWRWCVGGVVAGVWCGWSLATPGGGSCVLLPATPGWVSLPVLVGGPRHSWLGSAGGVGVWCVACGGGVLVGLWLVCGVVGPSPLLAEVPVCYSPPLLAGFRCRWWWAVPATPGWGPLVAVVCGVWCVLCGGWCACVFVCVLCLAGSGGPASQARFGAPHLFLWPICPSALLGPLRAGVAPLSLAAVAVPRCPGAVFWLFFFSGLLRPGSPCAPASFVSPAWPLAAPWWLLSRAPPLLCLAVLVAPTWCLGFFFLLLLPLCAPVVSGFLWFPAPDALGLGACVVCFVGLPPLGSPCACPSFVLSAWLLGAPWWLLPPPAPLCVSRFSSLPLGAVCRVVLCVPGCGAAPRCCALCRPVLCCRVVYCALLVPLLVAPCPLALPVALGPCALRHCVLRCFPALCALCCVCFLVARWCVLLFAALLCAVCVLGCCAVRSLCSPLCAVLCLAVLVRSRCAVRVVRAVAGAWCCGALLCVVLFPVVCRGAVLGLVARGWLLVACFAVGVPVWPRGLLPCGWCGLLWCPAFLCRVLWCCAVAWCCAVVLCCRGAVLLGLALPSCGLLCCAVLCCWLAVLFFARWWCLRAVVLFSSCCAFPVFSALCAAVPCCAGCGALLPCVACCGAVLSCGTVLSCSAVLLRCCLCLLCPPSACRAAPVWSALLLVPRAVACPCACWCLPGRSAVWWCCSGVSWCLAVLCLVLWCPAPCAVSCGAVLPCGAVLVGCAVRLSALLVFIFPFVLFSFAKNPCRFSVPLKTF